jgi:hypothetical protein
MPTRDPIRAIAAAFTGTATAVLTYRSQSDSNKDS